MRNGTVAVSPLWRKLRLTMNDTETRLHIGSIQFGVVLLALATAGIHLYLFLIEDYLGSGTMLTAIPVASIASYYYVGVLDLVGNIDMIIEVLLIMLVTITAACSG
jgi:hypothetical protein